MSEIKKRTAACNGKGLVCCEKVEHDEKKPTTVRSLTTKFPTANNAKLQTTTHNRIPQAARRTTNFPTHQAVASSGDPLRHPNYKLFANLKCGPASSVRVAFGIALISPSLFR